MKESAPENKKYEKVLDVEAHERAYKEALSLLDEVHNQDINSNRMREIHALLDGIYPNAKSFVNELMANRTVAFDKTSVGGHYEFSKACFMVEKPIEEKTQKPDIRQGKPESENAPKMEEKNTAQEEHEGFLFLANRAQITLRDLVLNLGIKKPEAEQIIKKLVAEGRLIKRSGGAYKVVEGIEFEDNPKEESPAEEKPETHKDEKEEKVEPVAEISPKQKDSAKKPEKKPSKKDPELEKLLARKKEIATAREILLQKLAEIEARKQK